MALPPNRWYSMYISTGHGVLWRWGAVYSMRTVLSADASLSDWVKENILLLLSFALKMTLSFRFYSLLLSACIARDQNQGSAW